MKIGIMTFINTSNFGASLQMYALQKCMQDKGIDCEIVRYNTEAVLAMHAPTHFFKRKGVRKKLAGVVNFIPYKIRWDKFRRFESEYCHFSDEIYNRESIEKISDFYDRIVVGSDQVWNLDLINGDDTFFLGFVDDNRKKCSYAASVGSKYFSDTNREYCEELLKQFSVLSVREANSAEMLGQRIKRDVFWSLDPTLLIEENIWKNFVQKKSNQRDYILLYLVPENQDTFRQIKEFARINNCDIFLIRKGMKGEKGIKVLNTLSPIDFLNYLYNAKYVITGSFHALCFSIIYEKEFFITNSQKAALTNRLYDLLERVGISNRKLEENIVEQGSCIEYAPVKEKLKELRQQSNAVLDMISEE